MLRLVPFLAFAYVVAGLVAATSEAPIVFGRYSYQAAVLIAACLAIYVTAATAWRRRFGMPGTGGPAGRLEAAALLGLVALTFLVTGSNAVQRLPWVEYVLPAVRVLAGVALIAGESARARGGATNGPLLAASMVLLVWASGDLVVAAVTRHAPPHAEVSSLEFREPIDLQALPQDAIVLIGDSFVWGQGVEAGETFGAQLEARLRQTGRSSDVHSLGVVGAGLRTYLEALTSLPADRPVDRIALVFYMNDMPAVPRLTDTFRSQMIALGVGSPTLRIVGDLAARRLTPTLADYHAQVARDHDPAAPTFAGRWEALRGQLAEFMDGARVRSRGTPLLVVLPLMVDFTAYPLDAAHDRLGELGRSLGYEVVDLLPVFRDALGDGRRHLVSPEDNHFDPSTHVLVAGALARALANP